MTDDRMLQEAIQAIKTGQRPRARDLLTRLLRIDQNNVEYWLYMSAVVDTQKERIICLENVLKYDSENETAIRGLVLMGSMPPDESLVPVTPQKEREWDTDQIFDVGEGEGIVPRKQTGTRLDMAQSITLAVTAMIVVSLFFIPGIINSFYSGDKLAQNRPGLGGPLFTNTPKTSQQSSETPSGYVPPPGAITTPTPLSIRPETEYTPTPRYVNTPHPDDLTFDTAMRALDLGNYEYAIESFTEFIQSEPTALDARYYRGLAYLWNEEYETARDEFIAIIEMDDTFGPAYVGLAQAWLAINPEWIVGDELYTAISVSPDFIEAYLEKAKYWLFKDDPTTVINDAESALAINPDSGMAYYYLAAAYLMLERPVEALEAAQKAQELDATIIENYLVLGQAMVENDRVLDAMSPLQTYLSYVEDNSTAWYLHGRAKQAAGYHQDALDEFDKAVELQLDLFEVNYYRGISYMALNDLENAIYYFDVAVHQFPKWLEVHVALTEAYYINEDFELANKTITGYEYNMTEEQQAIFYYWRALTFERIGIPGQALSDWNFLLDLPTEATTSEMRTTALNHVQQLRATETPTLSPSRTPVITMTPIP